MSLPEFSPFPKIPRWSRDIIITEKLDGTNASIYIPEIPGEDFGVASRNRWITPENDNYGFAKWAYAHKEELMQLLGPGHHFGEWWGLGIQRSYAQKEKHFSLFNVDRWKDLSAWDGLVRRVPVLYTGDNNEAAIEETLDTLREEGSVAAPGFPHPEGIVIFHVAGGHLYKKTLLHDEKPKGQN